MTLAAIIAGLGLLGATLASFVKIVRHLTDIERDIKSMHRVVKHVPNLYYRVTTIERHLDISVPEMPVWMNGESNE